MGLVKNILYKLANKKFLPLFNKQVIFPYYHIVNDNLPEHIKHLYKFKNKTQFIHDIKILKNNYISLNPKDLLEKKTSKNQFLLTFDDGLQEIYSIIFPILKENNINAIFFINPDFVDNNQGLYKHYISTILSKLELENFEKEKLENISKIFSFTFYSIAEFKQKLISIKYSEKEKVNEVLNLLNIDIKKYLIEQKPYVTKPQIQEMINAGFYFGGHTMSHPPLNQLNFEEQKSEILESINWLKTNFGINYSMFAFPFTDKNISKKLLNEIFEYDKNILIFGNSGLKKDFDDRIIQRFSLENPNKNTEKQIVKENLYKYFNILTGKYSIKRK